MLTHPVTNNALLEGFNYRTWALAMERLLDSLELLDVVCPSENATANSKKMAKVRNLLSEHCVPDIRNVFFVDATTPPKDVWEELKRKFGPTNRMLGESAKAGLLRQRWNIGEDPATFLNRIDACIAELKYYGNPTGEDKLIEIFPTLLPNDGDWADFPKILMNSINLDWENLKIIFMKRANYSNSKPLDETNSVFQATNSIPGVKIPWHNNDEVMKIMDTLDVKFGILICLKCRRFGHTTINHRAYEASRPKKEAKPKNDSIPPASGGQANFVSLAEQELTQMLLNPRK